MTQSSQNRDCQEAGGSSANCLSAYLASSGASKDNRKLQQLVLGVFECFVDISAKLRGEKVEHLGSTNEFGEQQLTVDVAADQLLRQLAEQFEKGIVRAISSEEDTKLKEVDSTGKYVLCWDPLDGSSIVDCNFAVGTILGIWELHETRLPWVGEDTLIGKTARGNQVAAAMCIFGPHTTALLNVGDSTKSFSFVPQEHRWVLRGSPVISTGDSKIFSPANLRAAQDVAWYKALIDYWISHKYTLRYTGGLVPDVYQTFVKQQGIFVNPVTTQSPAKLRLLYETAPIAALVEGAGGVAVNTEGSFTDILDVVVQKMDHRTGLCCGSRGEARRVKDFLEKGDNS